MTRLPLPHRARSIWAVVLAGLALLIWACSLVPVSRTANGGCVVLPRTCWTLAELQPGHFESKAVDNASGHTLHCRLYQFPKAGAGYGAATKTEVVWSQHVILLI